MLEVGRLIAGRYEIRSELGGGGGGLVYEAIDCRTEKRVAVKVLRPLLRQDRAAAEKFKLEACVPGRVRSEHLAQVSDADVDPATQLPYLVMEYLEGQNLQELIRAKRYLDPSTVVHYLAQVASALDKAHAWRDSTGKAAPIVHRDLKPENIYLTFREDGTPLVKILDWGIAKVQSDTATISCDFRGTPAYMAPEQLTSPVLVTPATDVWALGLIAFFLLTGHCYWRSGQEHQNVLPIINEVGDGPQIPPSVRIRELGVEIPITAAFDAWFLRCVHLDPKQRFQHAGEAVRLLAAALQVKGEDAPQSSAHRHTPASSITPGLGMTVSVPSPPISRDDADAAQTAGSKTDSSWLTRRNLVVSVSVGLGLVLGFVLIRPPLRAPAAAATPSLSASSLSSSASPTPVGSAHDGVPSALATVPVQVVPAAMVSSSKDSKPAPSTASPVQATGTRKAASPATAPAAGSSTAPAVTKRRLDPPRPHGASASHTNYP